MGNQVILYDCEQTTGFSFPPSSVGIHTELCYWLGMRSHAGAWEQDKLVI